MVITDEVLFNNKVKEAHYSVRNDDGTYSSVTDDEAIDAFVIHCLNGFHFSPLQVVKQETASHQEEPEGVLQEPCPTSLIALSQKS